MHFLFLQQILAHSRKAKSTNNSTKTALTCDKKALFPYNLILSTTSQYERYGTIINFVKSILISDLQFYLSKVSTEVSPLGWSPTV